MLYTTLLQIAGIVILTISGVLVVDFALTKSKPQSETETTEEPLSEFSQHHYVSIEKPQTLEKLGLPSSWKCKYCETINDWNDKKCSNCGSPRRREE